jgi:hypothetical protein
LFIPDCHPAGCLSHLSQSIKANVPSWAYSCEYLYLLLLSVGSNILILSRHDEWSQGKEKGKDELIKGKLALQHSLGLGAKPNVIPPGEARVDADLRTVEIGWHPVAGMGGKWLAEKSGLGKMITKNIGRYPDPTQHWAVLVGEYVHELWMDEELNVIYINEKLDRAEWHTFEVGKTRFTDEALRQAGQYMSIFTLAH